MKGIMESWGLILAGGDGSRLREVTTTVDGQIIPKQYCSIGGATCLLEDAIRRARSVAMASQVAAVVAAQHRRWWSYAAAGCNEAHIFVQPQNRGTANGILFALLKLEQLSPNATVTLLPADHYYRDERALTRALRAAVNLSRRTPEESYLLGADPESPDPELGYILPASRVRGVPAGIAGFKEKPSAERPWSCCRLARSGISLSSSAPYVPSWPCSTRTTLRWSKRCGKRSSARQTASLRP